MADLADLGIRVRSEEVAVADERLDDFTASAMRAENAAESFGSATRATGSGVGAMTAAVRQQNAVMSAARHAAGLTSQETLNLSRQFADVGVSIASGMPIWMVAIQQGSQIGDTFQTAAQRGVGFSAVIRGVTASLGGLLLVLSPIVAVTGAVAGGFALLHRELSKGYPKDITEGLGLTEEQLKRVETRTVGFGHTFQATMNVIGRHIMDSPIGDALDWVGNKFSEVLDWIGRAWAKGWASQIGITIGAYRTIIDQWQNLPAVIGDLMVTAANHVIRTVEGMANAIGSRINGLLKAADTLAVIQGRIPLGLRIPEADIPEITNQWAGAGRQFGSALSSNIEAETAKAWAGMQGILREIGDEALRLATADALKEAGDPNKSRSRGGRSELEKQIEETLRYIQTLKDQAATMGLSAIEARRYEIAQRALKAPTADLRREVEKYGEALLDKMSIEASNTRAATDQLEILRLEVSLVGAGNVERAVAIAQMQKIQELGRAGLKAGDPGYAEAVETAGDVARAQEQLRIEQQLYNDSLREALDLARQIDDHARDAARGMASAFGDAGDALGGLLTTLSGYQVRLEQINEAQAAYTRLVGAGNEDADRLAMFERDRAQAQIQNYGDMAGAARGFFAEGSAGYRILLAIEQAYRLQQMIGMLQSMALGQQETASTVAGAATRGSALAAEGAARIFAALGPWAFPVVAAMFALLSSLGVSGGGGGGSPARASGDADSPDTSTATVRALGARDAAARESSTAAFAQAIKVEIELNDPMFTARVRGEAARVAAPMAVAAASGAKRDTLATIQGQQAGNRKVTV